MASHGKLVSIAPSPGSSAFPQLSVDCDWRGVRPRDWLECWSGIDGLARLVVTAERIFLGGDSRAEEALALRHDLRCNSRRLETVDPAESSTLDALVRVEKGETRTAFLHRRRRGGHLLMRATQLAAPAGMPLVGIAFRLADEAFAPRWADLEAIFGLTGSEAKIVELLLQGLGADAIASRQKISINTVRTHISHVYEKLGIACREELWRRLAPYRLN